MTYEPIGLTGREREVLKLMIAGYSNTEIAHRLSIAISTVKAHASSIIKKFGVKNRTEVAREATKKGYTENDDENEDNKGKDDKN